MTKAMFIGNSFIGDTILNLALIRAISKEHDHDIVYFPMLQEIYEATETSLFRGDWDDYWFTMRILASPEMDDYLNAVCRPYPAPTERYIDGRIIYSYSDVHMEQYQGLDAIRALAGIIENFGIETVYLTHWSLGYMILAEELKHRRIHVVGFKDTYGYISLANYKGRISYGEGVYTPEFVGDKLCKAFAGRRLDRSDFYIKRPKIKPKNDYVLLMPSTRAQINTISNWAYDLEILLARGDKVVVAFWSGDYNEKTHSLRIELEKIYTRWGLIPDIIDTDRFEQTVELVHHAKLVITPDSGQFHVAWIMDKPIIVKLKEGILYEWIPSEELLTSPVVTLAPCKPFAAEYVMQMKKDIKELLGGN